MTQPPDPTGTTASGQPSASAAGQSAPTAPTGASTSPDAPPAPQASAGARRPSVPRQPDAAREPVAAPTGAAAAELPPAATPTAGWRQLVVGQAGDPAWVRPAVVALLATTTLLYVWDLSASGYGNSFYAAAVQAGTESWKALLFGSLDAGNFITVDKPPASLWVMALSGRIFGFSSWSMLVPSALGGVAAVGLMYAAVRRWFGPAAGLLAGAVLALTPVAALMFRYDNPDGALTFVLVAAAYCLVRALERASTGWLAGAGAALGFAFLTKMLQGFLVLPAFALVYLIAAPTGLWRRVWQTLLGGLAVVAAAGWWVATVALWPKDSRPFIGGSSDNSVLNLAFGYNGLGRVFGGDGNRASAPGGGARRAAAGAMAQSLRERGAGGGFGGGGFGGDQAGWLRLFGDQIGAQVSWLLPGALILLVGGLWATLRAPRVDRGRAALILWGAWLIITSITLSLAKGTFHPYYTASIAPGIAGLVATGGAVLWRERHVLLHRAVLAAAVAATGGWAFVLLNRTSSWYPWLRVLVVAATVAVGLALLVRRALAGRAAAAVALVGLVGILGAPAAYTAATITTPQTGGQPTAGPSARGSGSAGTRGTTRVAGGSAASRRAGAAGSGGTGAGSAAIGGAGRGGGTGGFGRGTSGFRGQAGGFGGGAVNGQLTALLKGSRSYRWAAAVAGSSQAASLELASDTSVLAMGGFTGSDPAPTLAQFEHYVDAGQVRYFIGSGAGGRRGVGGPASTVTAWVEQHYTPLTVSGQTIYDLTRPTSGQAA